MDQRAIGLVRANFRPVVANPDGAERLAVSFYGHLFGKNPELRGLFPAGMHQQRDKFVTALCWVLDTLEDQPRLEEFLTQLGRDHRKYGVEAGHYNLAGVALLEAMRSYTGSAFWTTWVDSAWRSVIAVIVEAMANGADTDDLPSSWEATVVEHHRLLDDLSVVRLRTETPVPYEAGQYLPVRIPQRPRMWRYLSPAIPPNPYGEIEFHVRRISGGWVSPSVVNDTRPGDRWTLGAPLGGLRVDTDSGRDVLMIASGTGLAPMRAQIMEMTQSGVNPQVHLFLGGRHPCDLYDVETMWKISLYNPWLTVLPVSELNTDPWWYTGPPIEAPYGMHRRLVGRLGRVVASFGSWSDRQIQIAGSATMIRNTIQALRDVGTPLSQIQHDPV